MNEQGFSQALLVSVIWDRREGHFLFQVNSIFRNFLVKLI